MTPKEILIEAKKLLEEKGWCQGSSAIDQNGIGVSPHNLRAVKYCSIGALYRAGMAGPTEWKATSPKTFFEQVIGGIRISIWNDQPGRTKEEVLTAFDQAIKLAEQGENNAPSQA